MPSIPRGKFIVLEGLDRSGKSTQTALLTTRLRAQNHTVTHLRFPDRTTPTGTLISAYLTGANQLSDHAIHLLFAANRWEKAAEIEELIARGEWVVADRYYYSGVVYSAAKGVEGLGVEWCRQVEVGLPRPDVVVVLDAGEDVVEGRGGFGEERYEEKGLQGRVREGFRMLGGRGEGEDLVWVDAKGGVEEVEIRVWEVVEGAARKINESGRGLRRVGAW
ncbi:hypothetical protein B0A50_06393 [Salinomyces thailandicus]|uniref:Thymidylate kinase n=1 Tax=Salinomyces thailandicus TaxID=706561 RepID=A0A4U0TR52_9PEZI|nr:hypothetical protein B0A50_06393 [Salinomyces thailandica]